MEERVRAESDTDRWKQCTRVRLASERANGRRRCRKECLAGAQVHIMRDRKMPPKSVERKRHLSQQVKSYV
eukprot:2624630-Pleurochrysis_carterae.AAC.1